MALLLREGLILQLRHELSKMNLECLVVSERASHKANPRDNDTRSIHKTKEPPNGQCWWEELRSKFQTVF